MLNTYLRNKQRTDSDPGFSVSICGLSRADWSLLLDHLQIMAADSRCSPELLTATQKLISGLESHVVDNFDRYTLGSATPTKITEAHVKALAACQSRHAEEQAKMESFAMEVETRLKEKKRRKEKLSEDEKVFLRERQKPVT